MSRPTARPGEVNVTDPDSRVMKAFRGWVQGYNVQTAVNENQIALAGEITTETIDFGQLRPHDHTPHAARTRSGRTSASRHRSRSPTPATGTSRTWTT